MAADIGSHYQAQGTKTIQALPPSSKDLEKLEPSSAKNSLTRFSDKARKKNGPARNRESRFFILQ